MPDSAPEPADKATQSNAGATGATGTAGAASRRRATTPLVLGLLAVVVIGSLLYSLGTIYFSQGPGGSRYTGEAAIGGPFALTDHTGRQVTEASYRGRFMLLTFGYTFCPDICPTTLTDMSDAITELGADGDKVVPIMITVDPARDTVAHLKDYVGYFHPRTVGLTGSAEAVKSAAKAYKVYYAKAKQEDGADAYDYLMDHSTIIYLMGPDGNFLSHYIPKQSPEKIAEGIKPHLGS